MMHVRDLLKRAIERLIPFSDTARLDAELLLSHVLQLLRPTLLAYPEREVSLTEQQKFESLVVSRERGEPVAYLLGVKEFWSMSLKVNKHTLIPRPETELLVELSLKIVPDSHGVTVADLGTGSGAVGLALASERPHWSILAVDRYPETLAIAEENAHNLSLKNVTFALGSWHDPLCGQMFDAVVSNPPYLAEQELQENSLAFEPKAALVSGISGLEALEKIILESPPYLKKGGWLLLEHGAEQATQVMQLFQKMGYKNRSQHFDLAGLPRVVIGQLP